jgi:integrase/recombinase XerC
MEDFVTNIHPEFKGHDQRKALWQTERVTRLSAEEIDERCPLSRKPSISMRSWCRTACGTRMSHTALRTGRGRPVFVQQQVGHAYALTAAPPHRRVRQFRKHHDAERDQLSTQARSSRL